MWSDEEVDDLLNDLKPEEYSFGDKKSRSARTGRRARKPDTPPDVSDAPDDGPTEDIADAVETKTEGGPPKPSRRVSGWGAEPSSARPRRGLEDGEDDDERLRPRSPVKDDEDSDDDIPVIPELEDTQDDDLTAQVAMAPNVAVNRVATYKELDTDLMKHATFLTLDNEIDLKLLSKGLSAEADVVEEDKPWDWDRLFTEVSSELLTEWERAEQPDEEKTVA